MDKETKQIRELIYSEEELSITLRFYNKEQCLDFLKEWIRVD